MRKQSTPTNRAVRNWAIVVPNEINAMEVMQSKTELSVPKTRGLRPV